MEPARLIFDLQPYEAELRQALEYDFFGESYETVQEKVTTKDYVAVELPGPAIAVLDIKFTAAGRVLNIVALAGKSMHREVRGWVEVGRRIAKEQDCVELAVAGRKGWGRVLRRLGFEDRSFLTSLRV